MTKTLTNDTKLTVKPASLDPKPADRSKNWKVFDFETGIYALYVPSSHFVEITEDIKNHLKGTNLHPDIEEHLNNLELKFVPKLVPEIKTDIGAVSLNMAQGCNLRCTYCFAGEGDYGKKSMMTTETGIAILKKLSENRESMTVIFFGGEPLLNFKAIKEIVEWCNEQKVIFRFAMTTNATLLTKDRMAFLKDNKFALTISYDGKGLHSKQRLNKNLTSDSETLVERKIKSFVNDLKDLRGISLRATVTKQNLPLLKKAILNTLTSENYKIYVSIHSTAEEALEFGPDDIKNLGSVFNEIVDTHIASGDYESLLRIGNLSKFIDKIHHGRIKEMACGAGLDYLTASTSGQFYLCHRFNEDETENFGNYIDGPDIEKLQEIVDFRHARKAPCNTCWMREWCAGGCMHEHKARTGNKFEINTLYCMLQAVEIKQALRVYTHLITKRPDLLT